LSSFSLHQEGQFAFADFALEFLEVVVQGAPDDVLSDFEVDPLQQALEVDGAAGACALAGVEEEVVCFLLLFQAYLAGRFCVFRLSRVVFHDGSTALEGVLDTSGSGGGTVDAEFADVELGSSHLDALSRH
jgi:hypothetical protein